MAKRGQQPTFQVEFRYFCPHTGCNWKWIRVRPGDVTCPKGHRLAWEKVAESKYGEEWQVTMPKERAIVRFRGEVNIHSLKRPQDGAELGRPLVEGEEMVILEKRGEWRKIGDGEWLHSYFLDPI